MRKFVMIFFVILVVTGLVQYQNPHFQKSVFENGKVQFIGFNPDQFPIEYDSIFLFADNLSNPQFYFQHIFTPVCEDNTCKPIEITLIWDLLGNYKNFFLEEDKPLTKVDHTPFSNLDYDKLHKVLADDHSILGSYSKENISDLYTTYSQSNAAETIDAISGATPQYIKEQTIEGALYTTHTLWHLFRGKISDELLEYTKINLLDEILMYHLISSERIEYVEFSLQNLESFDSSIFHDSIIKAIQNSNSELSIKIINCLPKNLILNNEFNHLLWNIFQNSNYIAKRQILQKLALCDNLSNKILNELLSYSENANESQYLLILIIFLNQRNILQEQKENLLSTTRLKKDMFSSASFQILNSQSEVTKRPDLRDDILKILKEQHDE